MKKTKRLTLLVIALIACGWWLSRLPLTRQQSIEESAIAKPLVRQKIVSTQAASRPTTSPEHAKKKVSSGTTLTALTNEQVIEVRREMKLNMAAVYTAQQAMHSDYKRYTTDMGYTGVMMTPGASFKMGFLSAYHTDEVENEENPEHGMTSDDLFERGRIHEDMPDQPDYKATAESVKLMELSKYCVEGCTASADKFEVIFAANLDSDDTMDVWTINEKKEMIHKVDDLKE